MMNKVFVFCPCDCVRPIQTKILKCRFKLPLLWGNTQTSSLIIKYPNTAIKMVNYTPKNGSTDQGIAIPVPLKPLSKSAFDYPSETAP